MSVWELAALWMLLIAFIYGLTLFHELVLTENHWIVKHTDDKSEG